MGEFIISCYFSLLFSITHSLSHSHMMRYDENPLYRHLLVLYAASYEKFKKCFPAVNPKKINTPSKKFATKT